MAADQVLLDRSTLKAFENAAAGHDGALSDESGALFIKPSTIQETEFYQTAVAHHDELQGCLPTFMGTLNLGMPGNVQIDAAALETTQAPPIMTNAQAHGHRITTDAAIVLENFEHRFKRANVIDLKLGSQLCAPDTKPEKAARLNKVASETTSGSLGFRITGMKLWNGHGFDIYDKLYGRKFSATDVIEGFATFFTPFLSELEYNFALFVLESIRDEVVRIRNVLSHCETRMFSSSLLIVYEGDVQALKDTMQVVTEDLVTDDLTNKVAHEGGTLNGPDDDEDYDDDDASDASDEGPIAFRMGLVDFAHASFVPEQGSDENVIDGLRNIEIQLDTLVKRIRRYK